MLAGSIRTGHWRFFTSTGLQSSPHRCHRVAPRVEIEIESPAQVAARATPPFPVCCRPPSPSQSTASGALQKKAVTDSPILNTRSPTHQYLHILSLSLLRRSSSAN